jgi:hypothetical protein
LSLNLKREGLSRELEALAVIGPVELIVFAHRALHLGFVRFGQLPKVHKFGAVDSRCKFVVWHILGSADVV